MRIYRKLCWFAAAASLVAVPISAQATNGYFDIGYGAGAHGMGGAQVAFPQDALVQANNPAGIIDTGTRFDIGAAWFIPMRRSQISDNTVGDGGGWSGVNNFLVPSMGGVFSAGDIALGFAMYGNGLKVLYEPNFLTLNDPNFPAQSPEVGVDLIQLFMQFSAAFRWDKKNTFGVAVVPARQRFAAKGLGKFATQQYSAFPNNVTDQGHDYANGLGWRVGWLGTYVNRTISLGATYASKVRMQKFSKYKGLFAEEGGFDVPANWAVGLALKATPQVTVALDVEKILYSNIPSVGNRGPVPGGDLPIGDNKLGLSSGAGFGWLDGTYYKLGINYEVAPGISFRAGYNTGKSTIPDDQLTFNMLAPATIEQHLTLGMTYGLGRTPIFGFGKESALSFSYVHAFRRKQQGTTVGGGNSVGEIEMFQDVFEGALNITF